MFNVIITAGGKSQRYGEENKLFAPCKSSCVLIESIRPFLSFKEISKIIVGIDSSFTDEFLVALDNAKIVDPRIKISNGGKERSFTVKNALRALSDDCTHVLIHDGARPFADEDLISKVMAGAIEKGAAVPLIRLTDALVCIKNGVSSKNRDIYRGVQTPSGFEKSRLLSAYSKCRKPFFDDISVVQKYEKGEVAIIDGMEANIKITTKKDLLTPLVGIGYDIHRFKDGQGIKLLSTFIPCNHSFVAHSDGDVAIHALMDAILSSLGEKDIGHLFPVDDAKYDDANSVDLLNEVLTLVDKKGYKLNNISVSIIAEEPKLMPYIDQMKNNMSKVLSIPCDRIGISATTNEQVGDIGSCQSIAAFATISLLNK